MYVINVELCDNYGYDESFITNTFIVDDGETAKQVCEVFNKAVNKWFNHCDSINFIPNSYSNMFYIEIKSKEIFPMEVLFTDGHMPIEDYEFIKETLKI